MAMIDNEMTTMNVAIQEHNYIERRSSEATLWNSSKDDLLKMIDETMMTMTTAMNDSGLVTKRDAAKNCCIQVGICAMSTSKERRRSKF